jgi:hypothetical protein
MNNIGFGDPHFNFAVYIANKPNMLEYQKLDIVLPLVEGEINIINQACGNGWRKVFNVYAKVLYCLDSQFYDYSIVTATWQNYRDAYLLQAKSQTALLFSPPQLICSTQNSNNKTVHIICGKGHAKALIKSDVLVDKLIWLDDEFAIDRQNRLIVCPYFDYRQLSNTKIKRLADLLLTFKMPLPKKTSFYFQY